MEHQWPPSLRSQSLDGNSERTNERTLVETQKRRKFDRTNTSIWPCRPAGSYTDLFRMMWTSIVSVSVFFTRLKRQMSSRFSLLSVTNFLQPLPRICCLPYLTWNSGSHASSLRRSLIPIDSCFSPPPGTGRYSLAYCAPIPCGRCKRIQWQNYRKELLLCFWRKKGCSEMIRSN